jgi:catechol 2,3-dioxygenase-like lactoylglutathione lyase family enzyme
MQLAVTLPASDIERAKDWYERVLRIEPVRTLDSGSYLYDVEGTALLIYQSEFAGTNQATAAALGVDDVEQTVAELRSRGAVFEEYDLPDMHTVDGVFTAPTGEKMAWLKDSEGNIISFAAM